MLSRSSVSEPAYLGLVTIVAFTIAVIVKGEINHLNHLLGGGAKVCFTEGRSSSESKISVLRELGRASS
jgi:hypothetical protein